MRPVEGRLQRRTSTRRANCLVSPKSRFGSLAKSCALPPRRPRTAGNGACRYDTHQPALQLPFPEEGALAPSSNNKGLRDAAKGHVGRKGAFPRRPLGEGALSKKPF